MSDERKHSTGQKISTLYAWIAEEADGGEGVAGLLTPDGMTPLIGADRARIESHREAAQLVATHRGCPVRLKMFVSGVTIDSVEP